MCFFHHNHKLYLPLFLTPATTRIMLQRRLSEPSVFFYVENNQRLILLTWSLEIRGITEKDLQLSPWPYFIPASTFLNESGVLHYSHDDELSTCLLMKGNAHWSKMAASQKTPVLLGILRLINVRSVASDAVPVTLSILHPPGEGGWLPLLSVFWSARRGYVGQGAHVPPSFGLDPLKSPSAIWISRPELSFPSPQIQGCHTF